MYENIFTEYSADFANIKAIAIRNTSIGIEYPEPAGDGKYRIVETNITAKSVFTLTGRYLQFQDGVYAYQIKGSQGYNYYTSDKSDDIRRLSDADMTTSNIYQKIVNEIIKYNKIIFENNLKCAWYIRVMEKNGHTVSSSDRKLLYDLQNRLITRNNEFKNNDSITYYTEAQPDIYSDFSSELQNFMNKPGIGVIPVIAYLVVVAVLLIIGGVGGYALFKAMHKEASTDIKYSTELEQSLRNKLTPEEYEQLQKENAAALQKAIDDANSNKTMKTAKAIAYALAGLIGFNLLQKTVSNIQTK